MVPRTYTDKTDNEAEAIMRVKDYQAILKAAAEVLGGAIHVVDADGITILYNEEMATLEKINVSDALGKPFREIFSSIPEEESTLLAALRDKKPTLNQEQTYLNAYGKEIAVINSTVPIIVDGKVVAAMEVAKDITDIKNMSDTILDLQSDLFTAEDDAQEDSEQRLRRSKKAGIKK